MDNDVQREMRKATLGCMTQHTVNAILNDDQSTTYNLALLRAAIDIALEQPALATHTPEGSVRVPYKAVVELWMEYYFPLVKSNVPQMHSGRVMAFQETYSRLIRKTKTNSFAELKQKGLSLAELRAEIGNTIHRGPVNYALSYDKQPMFTEFKVEGSKHPAGLEIAGDLWSELKLHGAAIRESLDKEWTKVSAQFIANAKAHAAAEKLP